MLFDRDMKEQLHDLANQYPVVTVIGPGQSGKTTLVKEAFPDKPYANLEMLRTRAFVHNDPIGFLDRYPQGAIIDEIQYYPALLSEIQARVDEQGECGQFILIGSNQMALGGGTVQSLAGRTAILHLLPMSMAELSAANISLTLDELLLKGGFPSIHQNQIDPTQAYEHYVQTYLVRDVRQISAVQDLLLFQKFMKLCAGRVGQLFNKNHLATETGVSVQTINNWLS